MFRLNKFLFFASVIMSGVLIAALGETPAQLNEDYEFKISFENQLEEKLRSVLSEITGTERIIAVVNADVRKGKTEATSRSKGKFTKTRKKDALVLPGVPVKKEIGKGQSQSAELRFPNASRSSFVVRRMTVTIFMDDGVSESTLDLVREVAMRVMGYSERRGDELEIKQLDFATGFSFTSFFRPPNLYWFLLIALGGFFLIAAALFLLDPFKKIYAAIQKIDWNLIRGSGPSESSQGTNIEMRNILTESADMREKEQADGDTPLPFAFIKERHLSDLAFLLREEPAQNVSIVANYLESDLTTRLLGYFPEEKRIEITLGLSGDEIDPERVHKLEETIKSRLDYVLGGESKLLSILDMTDEEIREKVFDRLKNKDADVAENLRRKIKSFESIIQSLPEHGVQVLYRRIDPMIFAQILQAAPEDIRQKVMGSLTAGAAERLQQEIEFSPPLPSRRLRKEKHNVMRIIRRLIDEGLIEEPES